jgi:Tfp pilus assembly protein PilO
MDNNKRLQERSQAKAGSGASSEGAVRIDSPASAALAEAVKSARESAKPALSVSEPKTADAASRWPGASRFVAQAAIALLLVGAGWSASYLGTLANHGVIERLEAETARSQETLARLSSDLESLKNTAAAFKEIEHTSSTTAKSEQTKLTDKVERLAISLQEPTKKLSSLESRLDKMESQIMTTLAALNTKPATSTAPAAPVAPPAPPVTEAAAREEAPAPKPVRNEPVDGWVLREVYKGAALVESRNRRLYEVMPGGILPGVGKVESIERRGARWVVLTDKGFIGTYR